MSILGKDKPVPVVAIAASAGGVDALSGLVAALPGDFAGAVLVVLHIPPSGPSVLPAILARAGQLPARHPVDGEKLTAGVIRVAPPDRHMVVSGTKVGLVAGARENGHRPAGDVLLRAVAAQYGNHAAGVVLSGTMDDGAAGLRAVRIAGGFTLVQEPGEANFPGMPLAAIAEADPHFVGPVKVIAERLCHWITELRDTEANCAPMQIITDPGGSDAWAELTPLTCPDCGGTLWRRDEFWTERFHCRVGHSYSADALLLGKQTALEAALWAAIVALEERADVSRRIARRLKETSRDSQLARYRDEVVQAENRAGLLRGLMDKLVQGVGMSHDEGAVGGASS